MTGDSPTTPIRVLIADDHGVVREGLKAVLERETDLQVVGAAGDAERAVELAVQERPDVVLMDLTMPGGGGIAATERIRERSPETRVLALTMHDDRALLQRALRAGAAGYVVKSTEHTELLTAIRAVARGDMFIDPSMLPSLVPHIVQEEGERQTESSGLLTDREREVLALIALGYTNRRIADELFISVRTVESHRANMMSKLGVHDRAGLVQHALRLGLIDSRTQGA